MVRRRWTVLLVAHDTARSRQFGVSAAMAASVGGGVLLLAAATLAVTTGVASRTLHVARGARLERASSELADTLGRLRQRLRVLSDSLAILSRRDDEARVAAGLDPLSPDVRRAGIGGPVGAWPERDRILADGGSIGREALGVHAALAALTRQADLLAASSRETAESLAARSRQLAATPSIMPTPGFISSNFMSIRYHPILHQQLPHEGIDIAAAYGAQIRAPAAGRVSKVGWESGYGLMVVIDHGYGLETRYAHMARIAASVGQQVRRGDLLGFVGSTGLSTGPHLHYEVRVNGRPVDPLRFVVKDDYAD